MAIIVGGGLIPPPRVNGRRFAQAGRPKSVPMDQGLVLVNWLYFYAIIMVNSGYLSLEKVLPP